MPNPTERVRLTCSRAVESHKAAHIYTNIVRFTFSNKHVSKEWQSSRLSETKIFVAKMNWVFASSSSYFEMYERFVHPCSFHLLSTSHVRTLPILISFVGPFHRTELRTQIPSDKGGTRHPRHGMAGLSRHWLRVSQGS
jgi:hypothetical protein